MIIEINYRAIKWDNNQGGSGMPYTDVFFVEASKDDTLSEVQDLVCHEIMELEQHTFTGEVELISVKILSIKNEYI